MHTPPPLVLYETLRYDYQIRCIRAQLLVDTRACRRQPQVGHYCTSFSVVPVFDVAILVQTPIIADEIAGEQGALVVPAGG